MIISHNEMHILYVFIFAIIGRSLLHWLKTKQAAKASEKMVITPNYGEFGSDFLAIVALTKPFDYSPEAVVNQIEKMYTNLPFKVGQPFEMPSELAYWLNPDRPGEALFGVKLGETVLVVTSTTHGVEPSDFQDAIANSTEWPEVRNMFSNLTAEVAVTRIGGREETIEEKRLGAIKTMIVSSAMAELSGGFAIKWFESELLVKPQDMKQYVYDCLNEKWPTNLWVNFKDITRTYPEDQFAAELVTCGLASFIGREMQFLPANLEFNQLHLRAYSFAEHLIKAGPVFGHGHLITAENGERVEMQFADQGYWADTKFLSVNVLNPRPVTLQ